MVDMMPDDIPHNDDKVKRKRRKQVRYLAAVLLVSTLVIAAVSFSLYNKLAWQPDHEDLTPIVKDIIQTDLDIEGDWLTRGHLEGSALTIQKKKPDAYSIHFSTGGCLDDWSSKRKGKYSNGILRLNRPVTQYLGYRKFDTLYTVKVRGFDYLISQASMRFLLEYYSTDGVVDWPEEILGSAFHRRVDESELKNQFNRDLREKLAAQSPSPVADPNL